MTLSEIATLIGGIDSKARHYFSMTNDSAYTYWEEAQQLPMIADDRHQEAWRFYVHRYSKDTADSTAVTLYTTLDADPRVTVSHTVDYDAEDGYIHHIFECEGY